MRVNYTIPRKNSNCADGWERYVGGIWMCGKSVTFKQKNRIRGIKNRKASLIKR